jgi:hypothetical protein
MIVPMSSSKGYACVSLKLLRHVRFTFTQCTFTRPSPMILPGRKFSNRCYSNTTRGIWVRRQCAFASRAWIRLKRESVLLQCHAVCALGRHESTLLLFWACILFPLFSDSMYTLSSSHYLVLNLTSNDNVSVIGNSI